MLDGALRHRGRGIVLRDGRGRLCGMALRAERIVQQIGDGGGEGSGVFRWDGDTAAGALEQFGEDSQAAGHDGHAGGEGFHGGHRAGFGEPGGHDEEVALVEEVDLAGEIEFAQAGDVVPQSGIADGALDLPPVAFVEDLAGDVEAEITLLGVDEIAQGVEEEIEAFFRPDGRKVT